MLQSMQFRKDRGGEGKCFSGAGLRGNEEVVIVSIAGKDFGLDKGGVWHAIGLEGVCKEGVDALELLPALVLSHCCYYNTD